MSCEYCEKRYMYYDENLNSSWIVGYVDSNEYELNVMTERDWASVQIFNCPWCGEKLGDGE